MRSGLCARHQSPSCSSEAIDRNDAPPRSAASRSGMSPMTAADKPLVLITGAAGDIGSALAEALARDYTIVGLDRPGKTAKLPLIAVDLSSGESVERALTQFREQY